MIDTSPIYLAKAAESLAGAESEFANKRYNNCANRCYYACFQAAIHALMRAGIRPRGERSQWSHAFVPAQFDGELTNRRKLYPSELRGVLGWNYALRESGDYRAHLVTQAEATGSLRLTRRFVQAIQQGGGDSR